MTLDLLLEAILAYKLAFDCGPPLEQIRILTQCYMIQDELIHSGVVETPWI